MSLRALEQTQLGETDRGLGRRPKVEGLDSTRIRIYAKRSRPIVQANTEISRRSSNLFNTTEVAETIGTDLETINEWLEVGAIDRAVFGGGRFSKYELQRAALTFEMVKLGLAPSRARDVV